MVLRAGYDLPARRTVIIFNHQTSNTFMGGKMRAKTFPVLGLCILMALPGFARKKWNFSGQIRHRLEISGKDFLDSTARSNSHYLRTRFNASFKPYRHVGIFLQLQDSRVFGEESSTLKDGSADNLDLHQAYFQIDYLFGWPLQLKVGRMEAIYGPQRLIGAVGWHNIGRSFDGVRLRYQGPFQVDAFHFVEQEAKDYGNQGDKFFRGLYADYQLNAMLDIQPFILQQLAVPDSNLNRKTLGFYSHGKVVGLKYEVEFALQNGTYNPDTLSKTVDARMWAVNAAYPLKMLPLGVKVMGGLDVISGDDNPADDTYKAFNTLYATNHKYYGFMDYFLNLPKNTWNLGLHDLHFGAGLNPLENGNLSFVYHIFTADQQYTLANGSGTDFGQEIDLTLKYRYNRQVLFVGGASFFTPGDIFKEKKGPDQADWYYLMTIVNF